MYGNSLAVKITPNSFDCRLLDLAYGLILSERSQNEITRINWRIFPTRLGRMNRIISFFAFVKERFTDRFLGFNPLKESSTVLNY